jgi:hypothetical protein
MQLQKDIEATRIKKEAVSLLDYSIWTVGSYKARTGIISSIHRLSHSPSEEGSKRKEDRQLHFENCYIFFGWI